MSKQRPPSYAAMLKALAAQIELLPDGAEKAGLLAKYCQLKGRPRRRVKRTYLHVHAQGTGLSRAVGNRKQFDATLDDARRKFRNKKPNPPPPGCMFDKSGNLVANPDDREFHAAAEAELIAAGLIVPEGSK